MLTAGFNFGFDFIKIFLLIYALTVYSIYLGIAIISVITLLNYRKRNSPENMEHFLRSPLAPPITLIAPAYNEGFSIVDNVKSLLSMKYPDFQVVIVNDGSKDDTLEKLIRHYSLKPSPVSFVAKVPCREIKAIYTSTNPPFRNLVVIDKINGGKADALNAGINIASGKYIACVDVDCIIHPEALMILAKPFLEIKKARVVASGAVIRIANSCEIDSGQVKKVKTPDKLLVRFQVLEYLRAFLLGRTGWGSLNGLMVISGALGLFDKKIVIEAGGYDTSTVGEDMEIVVRMCRLMTRKKEKYRVVFIPDPLCWTEAPEDKNILFRQRNRWTRGSIQTLVKHKKMFFNPRFGFMGLVSFPYWVFFEWFAPILEFFGSIALVFLMFHGMVNFSYVFYLSLAVYSFGVMFTIFALLVDIHFFNIYKNPKEIAGLIMTAIVEPVMYHPFVVWCAIKGNFDQLKGKNSWGIMTRKGFNQPK